MKIAQADSIPASDVDMDGASGVQIRLLVHESDGAPTFFMRQFTLAPGGHTPEHDHDWEHEIYILAGSGEATTPTGPRSIQAGDVLYVAPGERHQFRNTGEGELKFLCLVPKP